MTDKNNLPVTEEKDAVKSSRFLEPIQQTDPELALQLLL